MYFSYQSCFHRGKPGGEPTWGSTLVISYASTGASPVVRSPGDHVTTGLAPVER